MNIGTKNGPSSKGTVHKRLTQLALFFLPLTAVHPGFNVTLGDVLLLAAIALSTTGGRGWPGATSPLAFAVGFLVVAVSVGQVATGIAVEVIDVLQAWMVFSIVIAYGWRPLQNLDDRDIFTPLVLAAVVNAIFVGLQIATPDAYLPTQARYSMGNFGIRPLGLTGNPNGLGLLMTWSVPLGVALAARSRSGLEHAFWSGATLLAAATGILSLSKISMLAIPLSLLVALCLVPGRKSGLVLGILLVTSSLSVLLRDSLTWLMGSIQYRLETSASLGQRLAGVADAWLHLDEWFLIGAGAGGDILYGDGVAHIHNQIIGFAVQYGLPAGMLLLAFISLLSLESLRGLRRKGFAIYALVFLSAQVTLLVHPFYLTRAHYLPVILLMSRLARDGGMGEINPGESA